MSWLWLELCQWINSPALHFRQAENSAVCVWDVLLCRSIVCTSSAFVSKCKSRYWLSRTWTVWWVFLFPLRKSPLLRASFHLDQGFLLQFCADAETALRISRTKLESAASLAGSRWIFSWAKAATYMEAGLNGEWTAGKNQKNVGRSVITALNQWPIAL